MLKTAFDNNTQTAAQDRKNRSWSYIGRFIWGFTMLEYQLNQLFQELLGGGPVPNNPRGQSTHAGYVASLLLT